MTVCLPACLCACMLQVSDRTDLGRLLGVLAHTGLRIDDGALLAHASEPGLKVKPQERAWAATSRRCIHP